MNAVSLKQLMNAKETLILMHRKPGLTVDEIGACLMGAQALVAATEVECCTCDELIFNCRCEK